MPAWARKDKLPILTPIPTSSHAEYARPITWVSGCVCWYCRRRASTCSFANAYQAFFTIPGRLGEDHAALIEGLVPTAEKHRLVIRSGVKRSVLRRLEYMNVHAASLFPGADGVGAAVQHWLECRAPKPDAKPGGGGE